MKPRQAQQNIPDGVMKTILMNHLIGRKKITKTVYLNIYLESINEAHKLLRESVLLFKNKSYQRSYFLSFSALEEISNHKLRQMFLQV